jgi:nicotinamide-nucleotide amidase
MTDPQLAALAAELGSLLKARGWHVATAESCTGGLVAGAITAIAGSSDWFEYGFVAYANAAKTALLDVPEQLVWDHGAVSEQTAQAMAEGALARSGADVALAVTGVAGPGGGTPAKPVGTVCFAWVLRDGGATTETHHFNADRAGVRRASVAAALEGAIARLRGD